MKPISVLLIAMAMLAGTPLPANEPIVFDDPAQEERFLELTEELRCLVCQNQSLADSDAGLAHDLRREIHDMIVTGKTDAEIKEFMVARYGDFVLYRPPVQSNTVVLWAAPLILLLIGAVVIARAVRRRSAQFENDAGTPGEAEGDRP